MAPGSFWCDPRVLLSGVTGFPGSRCVFPAPDLELASFREWCLQPLSGPSSPLLSVPRLILLRALPPYNVMISYPRGPFLRCTCPGSVSGRSTFGFSARQCCHTVPSIVPGAAHEQPLRWLGLGPPCGQCLRPCRPGQDFS